MEENIIRIKCLGNEKECADVVFGQIIDLDEIEYLAKEILFHTPGEHTKNGESFEMEVQIVY